MNGNATFRHQNVALMSVAAVMPDVVTTSASIDDRLARTLERLRMPHGLLQRVAGVHERRRWASDQTFETAAIEAGEKALAEAGVSPPTSGSSSTPPSPARTSSRPSRCACTRGWGCRRRR
ncbi:hypothetical protein GCM10025875_24580 [Litorihabitans aurantiacus]|uniref:Uncharacterized protein n=1 Tax=Litorihabitans aurantiacus TaxID=1930061 RepID=A0AA37XG86_9MICO|nr:hypothetical protein GCM10025875_24580 [Litorihabitans aurantiacus]